MSDNLRYEIGEWMTSGRAITLYRDGGESDNTIMFSVIYYMLLQKRREATYYDLEWIEGLISMRRLQNGVYCRRVGDTWPSAHDDHVAAAAATAYRAEQVYLYGKAHRWCWPTENRKEGWFWRFPFFVPFVEMVSQGHTNVLFQLSFCVAFLLNAVKGRAHDNSRMLLWVMQERAFGKHWLVDRALDLWRKRVGSPAKIFQDYFRPEHPLSKYAPGSW